MAQSPVTRSRSGAACLPATAGRTVKVKVGHDSVRTRTDGHGHFKARWTAHSLGRFHVRVAAKGDRFAAGSKDSAGHVTVFRYATASWYGPGLYGHHVACGGTLEPDTLGVANKTLPCGSKVTLRYGGQPGPRPGDRPRPVRRRSRLRPHRGDQVAPWDLGRRGNAPELQVAPRRGPGFCRALARLGSRLGDVTAEGKNLEAISKAIDQHNSGCPFPAAEVRMNPFEVERLGWEEIRGLPVVARPRDRHGPLPDRLRREGDDAGSRRSRRSAPRSSVGGPAKRGLAARPR